MTNRELEQLVKSLAATVTDLSTEVKKLTKQTNVVDIPVAAADSSVPPVTAEPEFPIPVEYKEIVSKVLNSKFGVFIKPLSDRPAFEFTVSVPKEYSNAPEPHWLTHKADLRPKVISYAEGANGVRDWVTRILNNFNQDIKSAIFIDRTRQAGELTISGTTP